MYKLLLAAGTVLLYQEENSSTVSKAGDKFKARFQGEDTGLEKTKSESILLQAMREKGELVERRPTWEKQKNKVDDGLEGKSWCVPLGELMLAKMEDVEKDVEETGEVKPEPKVGLGENVEVKEETVGTKVEFA